MVNPTLEVRSETFRSADMFKDDVRASVDVLHQTRLHDMAMFFEANPCQRFLFSGATVPRRGGYANFKSLDALTGHKITLLVQAACASASAA